MLLCPTANESACFLEEERKTPCTSSFSTSSPGRKKAPSTFSKSVCSYCPATFCLRKNSISSHLVAGGKSLHHSTRSPRLDFINLVYNFNKYQRRDTQLIFKSHLFTGISIDHLLCPLLFSTIPYKHQFASPVQIPGH